jgi:hypothetical protein
MCLELVVWKAGERVVGFVSALLVVVVLVVIWEMGWGSVGPSVLFVPILLLVVVAVLLWMVLMSVVVVVLVGSVVVVVGSGVYFGLSSVSRRLQGVWWLFVLGLGAGVVW